METSHPSEGALLAPCGSKTHRCPTAAARCLHSSTPPSFLKILFWGFYGCWGSLSAAGALQSSLTYFQGLLLLSDTQTPRCGARYGWGPLPAPPRSAQAGGSLPPAPFPGTFPAHGSRGGDLSISSSAPNPSRSTKRGASPRLSVLATWGCKAGGAAPPQSPPEQEGAPQITPSGRVKEGAASTHPKLRAGGRRGPPANPQPCATDGKQFTQGSSAVRGALIQP